MYDDRGQLTNPYLIDGESNASPTTSVSDNGQSPPLAIPQAPPVYYEPIPTGVFFSPVNQQPPPQSFPAPYTRPRQPSYTHPHTSIDRNLARQWNHSHREPSASNHRPGRTRPSHMRSSITARRWMIRINAIQQPSARSTNTNTTEHGHGIITDVPRSGTSQQTPTQPSPQPPTSGPDSGRREGDQQNDERINQEMERGFQVLWDSGGYGPGAVHRQNQ